MNAFLDAMLDGPRMIAVTGDFGSGKTEFCVSLAFALAGRTKERLAVADLDIENPYFRSRERGDALAAAGVRVYSDPFDGRNGSEFQVISASVRAPLEDAGCRVILDCGGGAPGAMILRQFERYFRAEEYRFLFVVNPFRPGSDTAARTADHLRAVERSSGLSVTGLVANAHLIRETTSAEVLYGWEFTREVSALTGVPALCACCMESLEEEVRGRDFAVFPIGMHMRESYLDRHV